MKNLKKVLSLVLALAMAMSLMTVAFAKDASELADYNKVSHKEAVDVAAAVGVMVGDNNGNYNPTAVLDRASAAKIVAYLTLGEDLAEDLEATGDVFSDVSASNWAAAYIEYCAAEGYIAGDGTGKFNPTGKLTGLQFGKMLLCVLGYDADYEGLTGDSWAIKTSTLGSKLNVFDNIDGKASANLTRENAAEMILNVLQENTVTANKGVTTTVNGVTVTTGASAARDNGISLEDTLYTDPELDKVETSNDTFGRPAHKWTWDGEDIGTYADTADYTVTLTKNYTSLETVVADILDATDEDLNADSALNNGKIWYNGAAVASLADVNSLVTNATAGTVVELYVNKDDVTVDNIVVYNYSVAEITSDSNKLTSAEKEDHTAKLTINGGKYLDGNIVGYDAATYVEGAWVAYIVDRDATNKIIASQIAESVEGTVDAMTSSSITVNNTKYTTAFTVDTASDYNFSDTYKFYIVNNAIVASEQITESATLDDVVYVVADYTVDTTDNYGVKTTANMIQVVDLKGEVATYKMTGATTWAGKFVTLEQDTDKNSDTYEKWTAKEYDFSTDDTYSKNTIAAGTEFKTSSTKVGNYYVNDATQYIVVEGEKGDLEVTAVAGGIAYTTKAASGEVAADVTNVIYTTKNGSNVAAYVVLDVADYATNTSASEDVVYVAADTDVTVVKDGVSYTVYKEDGSELTIKTSGTSAKGAGFYTYEVDEDGFYTLSTAGTFSYTGEWDDQTGYTKDRTYVSQYGTLLTVNALADIETANAVIIDVRDTDLDGQYDTTIESLADMAAFADNATKDGEKYVKGDSIALTMSIFMRDGEASLIVVTDATVQTTDEA